MSAADRRKGEPQGGPGENAGRLVLCVADGRLELCLPGEKRGLHADFLGGRTGYRLRTARSTRQLLARAVGFRTEPISVFDATAGLAADAFLLAVMGCHVTAVERSAEIAALVRDGLRRASADPRLAEIITQRFRLIVGDSREILSALPPADRPDVVYLDPMFAPRGKSAAVRKEMRLLRLAVGEDPDAEELLAIARTVARRRVVVKRRLHAPALGGRSDFTYAGRAVRFDVYLPQ